MNPPIYQNHTKVYIFNKEEEARQQTYKSQTPTGLQRLDDDQPLQSADDYLSPISPLERVLSKRWNGDFPRSGNPSFHRTKRGCLVQEGNCFSTTERTQPRAKQKTLAVAKEGAMKYTPALLTAWLDKIRYLCGSNCRT